MIHISTERSDCIDRPSRSAMMDLGRTIQAGRKARVMLHDPGLDHSVEDCRALVQRIAEGVQARRELIEANLGLAYDYGFNWSKYNRSEADELIGEAIIGLIKAADVYDPDGYGTAFTTIATWKMRGECARARQRVQRSQRHIAETFGSSVAVRGTGTSVRYGADQDGFDWLVPSVTDDERIEAIDDRDESDRVNDPVIGMLAILDARQRMVISHRFGLDGFEKLSLREIGERMRPAVSKERVRQIERYSMEKLRKRYGKVGTR